MQPTLRRPNGWVNEFDSLFRNVLGTDGGDFLNRVLPDYPMAMWEDETHAHLEIEIPGLDNSAFEVTVHDGKLTVKANRTPVADRKYAFNSRRFGAFERVFALPKTIDPENVHARYTAGILEVTLGKRQEAQPKRIEVRVD